MKLYIAVLDEFPDYMTPTLVAHTVLAAHLKMKDYANYNHWLTQSFKKVTLRVGQKEFDKIASLENVVLGSENKTLGGKPACAVFLPLFGRETPNVLKWAKLWKPKIEEKE